VPGVTEVGIQLGEQEILLRTSFDAVLPVQYNGLTIPIRVVGDGVLPGTAYFDTDSKALRFRPWLCVDTEHNCTLKLQKIVLPGSHPAPKILVQLIEKALRAFADNINGAIQVQEIRLNTPLFAKIETEKFLAPPIVDRVQGTPLEVNVAYILVNKLFCRRVAGPNLSQCAVTTDYG
jgi:hypothetical protein